MPSPRPVKPSFSVVVALTLTCAGVAPRSAASAARIASTWGPMRGRSQMIVMSALARVQPCWSSSSAQWRRKRRLSAPRHCSSEGGKCVPMSPSASAPEDRVAQRVDGDVSIGMGDDAALEGNAHAAQHEVVALAEGVHVEAVADPHHLFPSIRLRIDSASTISAGRGDLDIVLGTLHQARLQSEQLHRHRLVGDGNLAAHRRLQPRASGPRAGTAAA
jgi:hypothetical protein